MTDVIVNGTPGAPGSAGSTGGVGAAAPATNTGTDTSNSATAVGGAGGAGGAGNPNAGGGGAGGVGTATATTPASVTGGINATATSTGGTGGDAGAPGAGGLGAAGGGGGNASATATLSLSAAPSSSSNATATGGNAGAPSAGGAATTGGAGGSANAAATTTENGGDAAATAAATGGNSAAAVSGNGIDGALAQANAASTGVAATSQASATGGGGGSAVGAGNSGGSGGSLIGLAFVSDPVQSTATASSGTAAATANATGGTGGSGTAGAKGGAGGNATLTNAVVGTSSGAVSLTQNVIGGAGGQNLDTSGQGGAGGSATSVVTPPGAPTVSPLTAVVAATGGVGGGGAAGGAGGAATATIDTTTGGTITTSNGIVVTQNANAQAGNGGSAPTGAGGAGGSAIASDTGTASGGIGAFSIQAQAVAGSGGSGTTVGANGAATATAVADTTASAVSALAPGTASASATALAQAGGAATTLGSGTASATASTANGLSANSLATTTGGAGTANANAITSGGLILKLAAASGAPTAGRTMANATAEEGTAQAGVLIPGVNSYAAAGGLASFGSLGPNVGAVFNNPGTVIFGTGSLGGVYSPDSTGIQTYSSSISWDVNSASLPAGGTLVLGLVTPEDGGRALTSVTFSVIETGIVVLPAQTFTTAAAANTYFTDNLVSLGAAGAGVGGDLNVTVTFSITLSGIGTAHGVDFMLGDAPCFAAGTRILTTRGEVAVEDLVAGDHAVSVLGRIAEIIWTGHREVDCERHKVPADVWPVCIRADAFGPGVPMRALYLSPDHAVFVDFGGNGVLIPARYLVNDMTVVQEAVAGAVYWHVECARHEVLLAEGLPAESYLDTGNRGALVGAGVVSLHPEFAIGARATWERLACRPLVEAGPALDAARAHLAARAMAMGFVAVAFQRVEIGRVGVLEVVVPAGTLCVHLVSDCRVPVGDKRRLGVAIDAMTLDGLALPLGDACVGRGFHAIERSAEGAYRWTDGEGVLRFAPSDRPRVLAVSVTMTVRPRDLLRRSA